jgi:hypothetical protein
VAFVEEGAHAIQALTELGYIRERAAQMRHFGGVLVLRLLGTFQASFPSSAEKKGGRGR